MRKIAILFTLLLFGSSMAIAQSFGRNKPQYEKFDFEVLKTPTFDIYNYLDNEERLHDIASWSEQWYHIHQSVLQDTFKQKNPMVLYNDHADFQQTNTIQGSVSVGTGGVTEAFKNRVIYPIAMSNQQTHHVLGHELVHAFQYNMIINGDSTSLNNLSNLPLWMVEGLAEYLSIGREDANTAMWMRDAVLQGDVPSIKDLNNPKYFPYRYGQTFWAFVTGLKGDEIIKEYFTQTAKYGLETATKNVFGMSLKNLSTLWVDGLKNYYGEQLGDRKENPVGSVIISKDNGGRLNISPQISPNGRYLIFLSEKNLFSTDLFLADARKGEIIRTVASATKDGHVDDYSYIESAGTWSPDSKKFAFVAFSKGNNILIIKDVENGKTIDEFPVKGVPAFSNPSWSPDGKSILLAGLVQGQVDLYQVNLKSKKVTQLTNDKYSEMLPNWSLDGSKVVFATDRLSFEKGRKNGKWNFNLAELDVVTGAINQIDVFAGANNLNPVYDNQGNILFLSDRDGFRNMYRYDTQTSKVYQLTDLLTGISGITPFAPAISVTRSDKRDRVVYTHYWKNAYNIYRADSEDFEPKEVATDDVDQSPATLLQVNKLAPQLVEANLSQLDELPEVDATQLEEGTYQPKFKLDFISGSTGVGVGTSNMFGPTTGAAGGVSAIFSDILGNNQLFGMASLNGELTDFAGGISYLNRAGRISWGASLSHMPYRSGRFQPSRLDDFEVNDNQTIPVIRDEYDIVRVFEDRLGLFAQLPFSKTLRWEAGASYSFYYDRIDRYSNIYQAIPFQDGENTNFARGRYIGQDRDKVEDGNNFNTNFLTINTALVGDNSYFGVASPLQGERYRAGVSKYIGGFDLWNVDLDYRRYMRVAPFTFAAQIKHEGRYGKDASAIFPVYLGYPWNIRGFNNANIESILTANDIDPNILLGSKGLISKFEIRLPFTGPEQVSLFKSKFLFTELNLFADAGVVWNTFDNFNRDRVSVGIGDQRLEAFARPLMSAGASLRINVFGAIIIEPYYAIPVFGETRGSFGLNILPGW